MGAFIQSNVTISTLLAIVFFVFSVNTSSSIISPISCTAIAVNTYYLFLATLSWHCLGSFHLYRRLTDARNLNDTGPGIRGLYFFIGWFFPMLCVFLSVGLKSSSFGNASFCWLSWNEATVWLLQLPNILISMLDLIFIGLSVLLVTNNKKNNNLDQSALNPQNITNPNVLKSPLKIPVKAI